MKKLGASVYAVISYLTGFAAILGWIIFTGNLIPAFSIDGPSEMALMPAMAKNLALVVIFGLHHSIAARQSFKSWLTHYIPAHLERSTFVLVSGLMLVFLMWQWEPIGGTIWHIGADTAGYYMMYALFFSGWAILFISSFLINHFDLFGLRQAYLYVTGKPYSPLKFKVISFYKYVRHPLYLGILLGIWAIPHMTATHLIYALGLTGYLLVGIHYEEKTMIGEFGSLYAQYRDKTPKLIPFMKFGRNTQMTAQATRVEPVTVEND
ncbi:MAG: isoprenylcysteine carboxylmethyltransferase family protein [Lewinellaceae bacterium]|nr:isoprenylcysteine carboxylmethyltransferase family protein [Lewinellaceae bacterium]